MQDMKDQASSSSVVKPNEGGTTATTSDGSSPPTQDNSAAPADVDGNETNGGLSMPFATTEKEAVTTADAVLAADPAVKRSSTAGPSFPPPGEELDTVVSTGIADGATAGQTSDSDTGTSEHSTDASDHGASDDTPTFRVHNIVENVREHFAALRTADDGRIGDRDFVLPFSKSHPEPSLWAGQSLAGQLFSLDGTAALYANQVEGSIRHSRWTGGAPVDANEPFLEEVTTLSAAAVGTALPPHVQSLCAGWTPQSSAG